MLTNILSVTSHKKHIHTRFLSLCMCISFQFRFLHMGDTSFRALMRSNKISIKRDLSTISWPFQTSNAPQLSSFGFVLLHINNHKRIRSASSTYFNNQKEKPKFLVHTRRGNNIYIYTQYPQACRKQRDKCDDIPFLVLSQLALNRSRLGLLLSHLAWQDCPFFVSFDRRYCDLALSHSLNIFLSITQQYI